MQRLLVLLIIVFVLIGCSNTSVEPEYNENEFESALNDGEDLTGAVVSFTVNELIPDSAFGYNMVAGEHLNFVSSKNPNVDVGDEVIVEVEEIDSLLGSYIISYKRIE